MRCTTELTTNFALNMNLIGSPDLDAFLNSDSEIGSIEYWEAFEREEELHSRGEDGLLDALDFDTVPFEQVEDALSVELYEQDLAEDREYGYEDEPDIEWGEDYFAPNHDSWEKRKKRNAQARIRREKIAAAILRAKELYPHMKWDNIIGLHNAGWDVFTKTPV